MVFHISWLLIDLQTGTLASCNTNIAEQIMWYLLVISRFVVVVSIITFLGVAVMQLGDHIRLAVIIMLMFASFLDAAASFFRPGLVKNLPENKILALFFSSSWCYRNGKRKSFTLFLACMTFVLFVGAIWMFLQLD